MSKEEKNSNKCPICGRLTHKESKYCIFHTGAEEKTEKEFIDALKKYIRGTKEDKVYNFRDFIFIGDINFRKNLNITSFKCVDFRNVVFKGGANFKNATFEEGAVFDGATFEGVTTFNSAIFKGDTLFDSVTFDEDANFWRVTFKEHVSFNDTTFKGDANFGITIFERFAMFMDTTFKRDTKFESAIFQGHTFFVKATFEGNVSFDLATLPSGKKLNIKAKKKGIIGFTYTKLENVFLDLNLDEGVLIDFSNTLLRNTNFTRSQIENHILQEENKEFSQAREVYLLLKNNFHNIGRYDDESWAFEKEKEMERSIYSYGSFIKKIRKDKNISKNKNYKKTYTSVGFFLKWLFTKNFLLWIIYGFLDFLFGYGERPLRVIRFAIIIIIVSAFFYMYFGISTYPENIKLNLDISNNIITEPQEITLNTKLSGIIIKDFYNCFYFSTVTFTTLGYGDLRPLEGWSRIFAGTEAFIGAFMMALFVYTFARRTGGR